jgi:hypothetical protein
MPPALMTFHVRDRSSTPLQPLNAVLRFALELVALGLLGAWGHTCSTDPARRFLWLLAVPLLAAAVWGTFTVANDPSRGKDGPVRVSGFVRLGIEATYFGCAIAACYALSSAPWAAAFALLVCLHYATTLPRVRWLLAQR